MSFPVDITPPDDLGRDLQRAAPHVTDVGAWEAILPRARRIRRRRRAFQGGVAVLLAAMLAGTAFYVAQLRPTGPGITESTLVQPSPGVAALPPAPDSPTAAVLPQDDPDPRAVAVRDWIRALHAGDLEAAYRLLDPRAQQEYGPQEAFVSAAPDVALPWTFVSAAPPFTLRWGSWGSSESQFGLQLIDLGLVDGERLAVVTVFGQWSSGPAGSPEAYTAPRADSILVVSRPTDDGDGATTVSGIDPLRLLVADDPSESTLADMGRILSIANPPVSGMNLKTGDLLRFSVPRQGGAGGTPQLGTSLLTLDAASVIVEHLLETDDLKPWRVFELPDLPPGRHVLTVVFLPENGGQMSAAASFFGVGDSWGDPDEPTPTVLATDAPPLSEAASRAALESLDALLRAVRLDDRQAFVNLYAPTDRATAETIFADERARLQRLGSDAYYLAYGPSAQVNWMVGVNWGLTWTPMSPSPELGAWVAADPRARVLASITTMDGVTRFLPMDVDGDTVFFHVLGGDPGMEALGAFDILGRTPSDVVAAYFAAFQKIRYDAAWELLSDARPSLDRFKKESAASATPDRREVGQYVILDNGDAWVDVTVARGQPDVPPGYSVPYPTPTQSRWLCVKQDGEWRLDGAQQLTLP